MGGVFGKSEADTLAEVIEKGDIEKVREFLAKLEAVRSSSETDRSTTRALQDFDLNSQVYRGHTALQLAAKAHRPEIVRLLLSVPGRDTAQPDKGDVNIDHANGQMWTALHFAAWRSHPPNCAQCVADLLYRKADPFIAGKDGLTALDVARQARCPNCVRTIEDNVKLWQGWVDQYEGGLLKIPSWKPKWLVVLRDRRPNTGATPSPFQVTCSSCNAIQQAPVLVPQFRCQSCGSELLVCPSLQLAVYEPGAAATSTVMVLPDTAVPAICQVLPQLPAQIEAKSSVDSGLLSATGSLFRGSWKRALQSTLGSKREYGFTLKIFGHKQLLTEYCFRVATNKDREDLLNILKNPIQAVYEASMQSAAWAQRQTSPAIEPQGTDSVSSGAAAAAAAEALPSKTGHYGLQTSVQPSPAIGGTDAASASSSSAAAPASAAATPPAPQAGPNAVERETAEEEGDDEAGQCVVCMERPADSAVVPCGHMCGCETCLKAIQASAMPQCPMCRGPFTSTIRIYRS